MLSRTMLLRFSLSMLVSALIAVWYASTMQPAPPLPPPVEQRSVRGPASESDRKYQEWLQTVRNLPPEPTLAAWMMQTATSAISVNAEIPIWGVFLAILTGIAAFVALREQMKNHIKNDDDNFTAFRKDLREIRRDIRALSGLPHHDDDDES